MVDLTPSRDFKLGNKIARLWFWVGQLAGTISADEQLIRDLQYQVKKLNEQVTRLTYLIP